MEGLKVIDGSTGELVREMQPGDRIITKKQHEFLSSTTSVNEGENFIKLYTRVLEDLVNEDLTSSDWKVILVCLKHLAYYSGAITYENNGNFLTPADIEKESGISKRSTLYSINHLIELKILHKGETGKEYQLFANPYIFMKGTRVNKTLHAMFKKSKWCKEGGA